jgi:hypothetical protein
MLILIGFTFDCLCHMTAISSGAERSGNSSERTPDLIAVYGFSPFHRTINEDQTGALPP